MERKRREHGSGGIRERRPGVWELKFDIGDDPITKERRTRTRTFKGKRKEALAELRRAINSVDDGKHVDPSKLTISQYFDEWFNFKVPQWSPKTAERNRQIIENNLKPELGQFKLATLTTYRIDLAYKRLGENGRADGKGGLSPQSVKHCHRLLSQALKQAVKWTHIRDNPANEATVPVVPKKEMVVLSLEQTLDLLDALRGHKYFVPVLTAVMTGLRRGEVLALRWADVDLEAGVLTVSESLEQTKEGLRYKLPKNGKVRDVAMSPSLVHELKALKTQQAQDLLRKGIRQTGETLLCCRPDSKEINPEDLSRRFPELVVRLGLPRLKFHELRHTHATQLLGAGVHMKVMSERLGHSDIGITMNLYSHVLENMQKEAADTLAPISQVTSIFDALM